MGKNKLKRWEELETFENVIQPGISAPDGTTDHSIKGKWRTSIFRNNNPVALELACGKGEYTIGLSQLFPDSNFIGVDIKGARMWRGAKTASEKTLSNTAFLRTRIEFIDSYFANDEIDEIWIIFPDPHSDKKNSNKRLTCPWFLNKYRTILKNNGIVHLKTDNAELYNYTRKLVQENSLEIIYSTNNMNQMRLNNIPVPSNLYNSGTGSENIADISSGILSIRTHYEAIFMDKGLNINYLAFKLEKEKSISYGWEAENK